jgi:hypothetical protein
LYRLDLTMLSSRESTPPSFDGQYAVADLLKQFSTPTPTELRTPTLSTGSPLVLTTDRAVPHGGFSEEKAVAVEVPAINNEEEYDFLPGHSIIRHIMAVQHTANGDFYRVELESSDKELVSECSQNMILVSSSLISFNNSFSPLLDIITTPENPHKWAGSSISVQKRF